EGPWVGGDVGRGGPCGGGLRCLRLGWSAHLGSGERSTRTRGEGACSGGGGSRAACVSAWQGAGRRDRRTVAPGLRAVKNLVFGFPYSRSEEAFLCVAVNPGIRSCLTRVFVVICEVIFGMFQGKKCTPGRPHRTTPDQRRRKAQRRRTLRSFHHSCSSGRFLLNRQGRDLLRVLLAPRPTVLFDPCAPLSRSGTSRTKAR